MKSPLVRTAIVTSLITAVTVCALTLFAYPRLMNNTDNPQPVVNSTPVQDDAYVTPPPHARLRRASYPSSQTAYSPAYSQPAPQPVVSHHRSTMNSVLIVAGSSAAGAGIGALAGGKKGAGIGAIAGGLGGFIYDRATAHR